jgi:multisubunit Na+/H+ antiporter MnhG subunit
MEATELAVWGLMLGAISIAAAHSSLYVMWLPLVAFVGLTAVLAAMALDRARSRGDSAEGSRLASLSGLARCRLTTARPTGRTPRR